MSSAIDLDDYIRKVPEFPKQGVLFYDITGVLVNPVAFSYCINAMVDLYKNEDIDVIAAVESRGFVFAAPLAEAFGLPLVLIRKKGKLPGETYSQEYDLEYGSATLELHKADVSAGQKVLVVDDLIATGGSLNACRQLIEKCGASVFAFFGVIGLPFLNYRKKLGDDVRIDTLIEYFGE